MLLNKGGNKLFGGRATQEKVQEKLNEAMYDLAIKAEKQRMEQELIDKENEIKEYKRKMNQPVVDRLNSQNKENEILSILTNKNDLNKKNINPNEIHDEDDIIKLREKRKKQLQLIKQKHDENLAKGHGKYTEIKEDEFLNTCMNSKFCIIHFYHRDFERCKIVDKHLEIIAKSHPETRICKINAEKTPFFVNKLGIKILPTIVLFENNGKACDQIVGFTDLGNDDEFETKTLEERIGISGVIKMEKSFYDNIIDENGDIVDKRQEYLLKQSKVVKKKNKYIISSHIKEDQDSNNNNDYYIDSDDELEDLLTSTMQIQKENKIIRNTEQLSDDEDW